MVNVSTVLCPDACCCEPVTASSSVHLAFSSLVFHGAAAFSGTVKVQVNVRHMSCVSIVCARCLWDISYESLMVADKSLTVLLPILLLYINVICFRVHWFACQVVRRCPCVAVFAYS